MLFEGVEKLHKKYSIEIPKEYNDFILKTEMDDYYGKKIKLNDKEYEIGHFLKTGESSTDLFEWYLLRDPKYKDYLTIAFCIYDEEIAIKVRGENKGKVVLMIINDDEHIEEFEDETEEVSYKIIDIADNFAEFKNKIS